MASFCLNVCVFWLLLIAWHLNNVFSKVPSENERFTCWPETTSVTKSKCEARGCIWSPSGTEGVPKCFFPTGSTFGYRINNAAEQTALGYRVKLTKLSNTTLYGADIVRVTLDVEFLSDTRLRFKFYDSVKSRYEVPLNISSATKKAVSPMYDVKFKENPFSIQVIRKDSKAVLFDSSVGVFVFADQFLQISSRTASSYVYGIGEFEHKSYKHRMNWEVQPVFTRDQFPFNGGNLYGHHLFHMCLEEDAKAHGIFLLNSNAMDVTFQPTPAITYRTIGGVLDFYVFLGPSPEEVVQQYTEVIGRTFMPPYWSLGFQLSRWGYNNLDTVKKLQERMHKYDIPQDVQYGDIDYMIRNLDFTYDPVNYAGLPSFVRQLQRDGMRYIIILDPAIGANETTPYRPYSLGNQLDIWVKDENGQTLFGKVWPTFENVTQNRSLPWDEQTRLYRQYAAFPDFFNKKCYSYWYVLIKKFHQTIPFDGLWIDMNEPANFVKGSVSGCSNNSLNIPPYKPRTVGDVLADKTLCMSAQQGSYKHYDVHSLYGWSQAKVTQKAVRTVLGKRSLVISRSTFAGSGKFAGHWLGDNKASWDQLHTSIIGMLEFNLFGIPYIGADICGYFGNPSSELCLRWTQLGAFYPYSRNHNGFDNKEQDPASYGDDMAKASRDILLVRYTLLPYLYTLFYEARQEGSTVVRPLLHEFTKDQNTWTVDKQFLWGGALLITPVLDKGKRKVSGYFPDARWFDYYTGVEIGQSSRGKTVELDAPLDHINLHVRGDFILPTQEPANNTVFSRRNPLGLIVALGKNQTAKGQLFWDDGESMDTDVNNKYVLVEFNATKDGLDITLKNNGFQAAQSLHWGSVTVYGLSGSLLQSITVNGKNIKHLASVKNKVLKASGLKELSLTSSHRFSWSLGEKGGSSAVSVSLASVIFFVLISYLLG